jgi:hypothetical protein
MRSAVVRLAWARGHLTYREAVERLGVIILTERVSVRRAA